MNLFPRGWEAFQLEWFLNLTPGEWLALILCNVVILQPWRFL